MRAKYRTHPGFLLVAPLLITAFALLGFAQPAANRTDASRIVVDGSTTVGPIAKAFAEHFRKLRPDLAVTVAESGSGNGVKALINGSCDVATLSRFMTPAEYKAAVDKGATPFPHVVAIDGIAVVVHPSNPLTNLTVEQVRDIYAGKFDNWNQLGGPNAKIVRISRDTNSGTYRSLHELVMGEAQMSADTEKVGSNGGERQRVASTPGAIGYVGLGFLGRDLKALRIAGVDPSPENIVAGRYPIARPLFFVTNGYPALGSPVHEFVTLQLTPEGQSLIEELGFVPITRYTSPSGEAHRQ